MAYKYSLGPQAIGDLKATEDAQGDTLIDFGEDQINLKTSGSVRLQINNDHLSSSLPLSASVFHFADGVKIAGAPAGQDTVIDNQGNFYGNTINVGTVSSSNIVVTDENGPVYQFPIADGTSGQAITTDGAGNLTFSTISGGGGGGGSTSPAGSNTEIQYNNNGAFGASSNLTYDGTRLKVDANLQLDGEIIHNNYSKTSYPSNLTNTGSYAKQKAFIKELFYTKYNWSGTSYTDLFTIEPYDDRTGLPYTGSSIWAVIGIECTLTGHRRFYGNTFTKNYMVLDWAAGTSRTYNEYTGVRIGADPSVWFDADTSVSTNGIKLRFRYNNSSVGNANLHFVINAGNPIDDLSAGADGKHIYWVLTEHFNEPSE